MIEDVRVEEGHDDHLGQRVGPGFPGEEGGAHTLDYGRVRGEAAQGTPDTDCSRHSQPQNPLACNLQKTLKPLRTRRSHTTPLCQDLRLARSFCC